MRVMLALLLAVAVGGAAVGVLDARGQDPPDLLAPLARPPSDDAAPPGRRLTAAQVLALASAQPAVREERAGRPASYARVRLEGGERWRVSFLVPAASAVAGTPRTGPSRPPREIAQVKVEDASGRVSETWTGVQVEWVMARGYPGAFGGPANAALLWLAGCALFLLPHLRRPLRLLHADLVALLAFSVSYAWFNAARIDVSVPLAYPPLVYLLVRTLVLALRRSRDDGRGTEDAPLPLALSTRALGAGLGVLVALRVAVHAASANVIDVGYAGVIGADRLASGSALYGAFPLDNAHGDTYGPVLYLAYVPFELLLPWGGAWDGLPAAHLAAVGFDLLAVAALWWLGRRLRGPRLGLLLAWGWVTYPFTLVAANSSGNDALVAALVAASLAAAVSPVGRGAAVAVGGLTKFAPLLLAPALATYRGDGRPGRYTRPGLGRPALVTAAVGVAVGALLLAPVVVPVGIGTAWQRTLGFQDGGSWPFSVWGLHDLDTGRRVAQAAVVALALTVAFLPRRRDVVVLAALGAAVLLALQLSLVHWFYTYLLWVLPLLLVALLAPYAEGAGRKTWTMASARRGAAVSTTTPLSHGSASEAS